MSKKKVVIYMIAGILYLINFVLNIITYCMHQQVINLISIICWGSAFILDVVTIMLECKKKK